MSAARGPFPRRARPGLSLYKDRGSRDALILLEDRRCASACRHSGRARAPLLLSSRRVARAPRVLGSLLTVEPKERSRGEEPRRGALPLLRLRVKSRVLSGFGSGPVLTGAPG